MKVPPPLFNIILVSILALLCACKSTGEKEKSKQATFLRFHVETNADGTQYNSPVPVYRSSPMLLNVERSAALDEGFMQEAEVVNADQFGGHAIKITFNPEGTRRLDYVTSSHKGRRIGVQARWTEDRWLAAPLITRRITDGIFIFTPDATREESERLVAGLNNVIKRLQKPYTFLGR